MKKTSPSKITAWIWRGAALILAVYFLVALFAPIPFFGSDVGLNLSSDEFAHSYGNSAFVSMRHNIGFHRYATSLSLDLYVSRSTKYICAAAPSIVYAPGVIVGNVTALHTDNLIFESIENKHALACIKKNTPVIGLKTPRYYTADGELKTMDSDELPLFVRSYSSPMLPVINTGGAVWGMLLLTAIPILLSFLYSLFVRQNANSNQKSVLRHGARVKLVFALVFMGILSAPAIFYMPPFGGENPLIAWAFSLIRWVTPIISIPALSIWLASFKNKKLAPLVALGIMVLCLYQPLANLICLFATVIAWGYFVEGIRRFFVRFKKQKAE